MVTTIETENHRRAGRRNAAVFAATGATVAVLFLYPPSTNRVASAHASATVAPAGVVSGAAPQPSASSSAAGSGASATATPSAKASSTAKAATTVRVINGAAANTQYGAVQVQITVKGSKIVSATAIVYPQQDGRDREINSVAIPILQSEAVAAQSAQIDTVSGATFTSQGYIQSLQSALDAAHL